MIDSMGQWGSRPENENVKHGNADEWYDVPLEIPNEPREISAFTADVMHVANILTLEDDTRPVGGFKFRVFR